MDVSKIKLPDNTELDIKDAAARDSVSDVSSSLNTLADSLSAVATSGSYTDLQNKPTSLPASDVSEWAKSSTKPSYTFSEIQSKPTTISGYGITDGGVTSATTTGSGNAVTDISVSGRIATVTKGTTFATSAALASTASALNATIQDLEYTIDDIQTRVSDIEEEGYGVVWPASNPGAIQRVGNMNMHKTLPIQSLMRRCIKTSNGFKYIKSSDYTKYEDGTTVNYSTDGDLFVHIPKYWYIAQAQDINGTTYNTLMLYPKAVAGAKESKEVYVSAVEVSSDDATNSTNPALYSFIKTNITYNSDGSVSSTSLTYSDDAATYRGGDQRDSSSWDADASKCQLGRPVTCLTRAAFRTRASQRGAGYSQQYWTAYCAWVRLYVVEYCSFNTQASYNSSKTAEGYMQGGLGDGVSNISDWSGLNGYNPVNPCGVTLRLVNNTGTVKYTQGSYTTYVPSYRGIENPFGNIQKWTDGLNKYDRDVYVCDDITKFADDTSTNYEYRGKCSTDGWVTNIIWDETGEFVPNGVGGSESTYFHDYSWFLPGWMVCYSGGGANIGAYGGLFYFDVRDDSSYAYAHIGGRLYYTPQN